MALYFIGLGLGDEKDITLKGLEAIEKADKVYLENYTSRLSGATREGLEKFYKKKIILADREMVESKADETILKDAKHHNVAFLAIGDPFSATTHVSLKLRADELKIKTIVIANSSIINSVGITGLDLYKFGRITTIPFQNENITSPYEVVQNNLENNMHTLVLLDLDPSNEKFMTVSQAISYLLRVGMSKNQLCIGCAGIGSDDPQIKAAKAIDLEKKKFTKYPQCIIVVSKLHFMEEEALKKYY